jgi:tetratricopeptide (TPR) repeat protein
LLRIHAAIDTEEAVASYDRAIALKPDYAEAHCTRGTALVELKRPEEAVASYDSAIALKPDYAEARHNQSLCLLQMGQYKQGWIQHEWRKRIEQPIAARSYPQPMWLGEQDIFGKTLFLWWEQGLGDTIQFCRYANLVEARGRGLSWKCSNRYMGCCSGLAPICSLSSRTSSRARSNIIARC